MGQLEYLLTEPGANIAVIAGGITGGMVLFILILLVLSSAVIYCCLSSLSKYKEDVDLAQQSIYM